MAYDDVLPWAHRSKARPQLWVKHPGKALRRGYSSLDYHRLLTVFHTVCAWPILPPLSACRLEPTS